MKFYEIMYIINSSLEPSEITQVKSEVLSFLEAEGADIYNKSDSGRTRLAYEIEKQRYGNYILLRFSSKPELIRPLREKFGLMDAVLSSLAIVLDKEPERIEEEIIKQSEPETFNAKDKQTTFVKAEDKAAGMTDAPDKNEEITEKEITEKETTEKETTEKETTEKETTEADDELSDAKDTPAEEVTETPDAVDESEETTEEEE